MSESTQHLNAEWCEPLIVELAARRCIIFLGAGTSKAASKQVANSTVINPPDWKKFLETLLNSSKSSAASDVAFARELLQQHKYLECAEIIRTSCVSESTYNSLIGQCFEGFKPTNIHSLIEKIDQKIVVTTNYDTLYEDHCRQGNGNDGYVVVDYSNQGLLDRIRSPKRIIIKAHGSRDAPERTILSKSDYFRIREEYQGFFKILESLFLSHTLLFIGYSLGDPDINLLLESVNISTKSTNPHYALMPKGNHPSLIAAIKSTYNIEIIEFDPGADFKAFEDSLGNLAALVNEYREVQQNP